MEKNIRRLIIITVLATLSLSSCVYFNTVYNARTSYDEGLEAYQNESREGKRISSQTRQKFQQSIDKGKKILTDYSDSKYVDDAYLLIGKSYYYLEQYGLARKYLSDLISNYPNSEYTTESRLYLGKSEQAMNDLALARHEFEYIISNSKNRSLKAQAYLALSDLNKAEGKTKEMLADVESAIDNAEDNEIKADAAWRTAKWAMEKGEYDRAQEFYDMAAHYTTKPQFDRQIQLEIAQLHREEGNHELAKESVKKMLTKEDYKDLWPDLEVELGRIYDVSGDTLLAADQYRYVNDQYPRTSSSAEAYYFLGEQAFARNQYDDAKQMFSAVKRMDSKSEYADRAERQIEIINAFSRLKNERQNLEKQIVKKYTQFMHPESANDSTASDTTKSLLKGLIDKATESDYSFQDAYSWVENQDSLTVLPDYLEVLYQILEYYYYDLKQPHSAKTLADSLVDLAHTNEFKAKVRALQAQAARTVLNDSDRAEQIENTLIERYPETSIANHLTGMVIESPKDSLLIDGKPLAQRYASADSLISGGFYTEAIHRLNTIHQLYPNSRYGEKAQYSIAWIYDNRLMQLDSALANYNRYKNEYPDGQMSPEVDSRLAKLQMIQSALARAEESDQPSQHAERANTESQPAIPDSVVSESQNPEPVSEANPETEVQKREPQVLTPKADRIEPDTSNTRPESHRPLEP